MRVFPVPRERQGRCPLGNGRPSVSMGPPPEIFSGASLYNIYFVDENVGYITGGRSTILKTEDGGKTWARKTAMSDTPRRDGRPGYLRANLMGIQMMSETTGFIVGSENTILKTTDGGETWIGSSERARKGVPNGLVSAKPATILKASGLFPRNRLDCRLVRDAPTYHRWR